MYGNKSFIAIIPARGGSKGLFKKNITVVNGKPLIQYTIDEALSSKYLDKVIISTDDPHIAEVARSCGAETPFMRPKKLASDESKIIDCLIYTVNELRNIGLEYDYVVLLQPTQPLRRCFHIDAAIEKIVESNENSLVSVSVVKENPILMRTMNKDGVLKSLLNQNSTIRRQNFPIFYKVNGAIYINKQDNNFNESTSLNDNKLAFIMDIKYDLDIDEPQDIEIFKKILIKNSALY